jgi:hypothetical protein
MFPTPWKGLLLRCRLQTATPLVGARDLHGTSFSLFACFFAAASRLPHHSSECVNCTEPRFALCSLRSVVPTFPLELSDSDSPVCRARIARHCLLSTLQLFYYSCRSSSPPPLPDWPSNINALRFLIPTLPLIVFSLLYALLFMSTAFILVPLPPSSLGLPLLCPTVFVSATILHNHKPLHKKRLDA